LVGYDFLALDWLRTVWAIQLWVRLIGEILLEIFYFCAAIRTCIISGTYEPPLILERALSAKPVILAAFADEYPIATLDGLFNDD
jgi:hypothetical protein